MNTNEHLKKYTEGLRKGDTRMVMAALDRNFHLDLTGVEPVYKETFTDYFSDIKGQIREIRGQKIVP